MHAVARFGLIPATSRAIGNGGVAATPRRAKTNDDRYLKTLGARVRDARSRHGMSRRMLAHDSGISERYLAELESGRGNFSIVLMRRLAKAIDVPVAELVSEEAARPVEYKLLVERIGRLDTDELTEASTILTNRFGDRIGKAERIALIGLRGAGKTTLGAMLAKRLGWEFVEMSREIESRSCGQRRGDLRPLGSGRLSPLRAPRARTHHHRQTPRGARHRRWFGVGTRDLRAFVGFFSYNLATGLARRSLGSRDSPG